MGILKRDRPKLSISNRSSIISHVRNFNNAPIFHISFVIVPHYRKIKLVTAVSFLLVFLPEVRSLENQASEGFRGINWGDHINTLSGIKKIGTREKIDIYVKERETLQIDGTRVETIEYYFYNQRLMGAHVIFEGFFNFNALKKFMFNAYGPGKKKNYFLENYIWLTTSLLIELNYTTHTNSGFILFCYLPLWNKYEEQF